MARLSSRDNSAVCWLWEKPSSLSVASHAGKTSSFFVAAQFATSPVRPGKAALKTFSTSMRHGRERSAELRS
jgi:hypothetical protein